MTLRLPRPPAAPPPAPPPAGRGQALLTWLGSTKNVAGCAAGGVGVVLTAVGLVEAPYWPLAVASLYTAGALAAPGRRPAVAAATSIDIEALRTCVATQLDMLSGRVPDDVLAAAGRVAAALTELFDAPHLLRPGMPETFVVERTVADYLPTPLETYANLPASYAEHHRLDDGRTPHAVVTDQLALLEQGIRELISAAARHDTAKLLAHGRFLDDTFGASDLDINRHI